MTARADRMTLTQPQVDVLAALKSGTKTSGKITRQGTVNGRCAAALEEKGLVWIESSGKDTLVRLTAAGETTIKLMHLAYGKG